MPNRNERKGENRKVNGHERRSDNETLFLYLSNCRTSVDQTSGIKISFKSNRVKNSKYKFTHNNMVFYHGKMKTHSN